MTARRLRLTDAEREQLRAGAAALGVEIDASAESRLAAYADLLGLWSERVNLISCATASELVDRHFLDSLAAEPLLPEDGMIVDLGSGAGFPGVPLAIANPARRMVLVEVRRRRANFLREVRRALGLERLEVLEQRAEQPLASYDGQASCVVSRAVWKDKEIFEIATAWLGSNGHLVWLRTDPLTATDDGGPFVHERTVRYQVGDDRPRVIEVFARR